MNQQNIKNKREDKAMDGFGNYMNAQAEKRAAYERYNYAGAALKNAQIRERLAEINSQHEPLAGLLAQPLSERDRLYAAAFYVVVGRMPNAQGDSLPPQEDNHGH